MNKRPMCLPKQKKKQKEKEKEKEKRIEKPRRFALKPEHGSRGMAKAFKA